MADADKMQSPPLPTVCTPEWLRQLIFNKHDVGTTKNITLSIRKKESISGGYLSYITKLHFDWSQKLFELPNSLIVKIVTVEKFRLEMVAKLEQENVEKLCEEFQRGLVSFHNNECYMYAFLDETPHDVPRPICYAARCVETGQLNGLLVLEDLSEEAASIPLTTGFSYEVAKKLVSVVANIQAKGFSTNNWVSNLIPVDRQSLAQLATSLLELFDGLKEKYPQEYDGINMSDIKPLCNVDEWIKDCHDGPFQHPVLVHGDMWSNNILVHRRNGLFTDDIAAVIDWQISHVGQPGEDLAYIIVVNTSPEIRRKHEYDLIAYFHAQLCSILGREPYSLQYVEQCYRKSMQYATAALLFLHTVRVDKLTVDENKAMAQRVTCMIQDMTNGHYGSDK